MFKKKLNIVLYKKSFYFGGAEKQIVLLANQLHRNHFNVFLITFNADSRLLNKLSSDIIHVTLKGKNMLNTIVYLRRFFKKNMIDICHTWDFVSSVVGFLATRFSLTKFLDGSIRSAPSLLMFRKRTPLWLQKIKVKLFSILGIPILSNSYVGLISYEIHHYPKAKVIYNLFVQQNIRSVKGLNLSGKVKIGMVANMRWKKDFITFIKGGLIALQDIPVIHFYLIGDGPDRKKYVEFLNGNVHQNTFHFTGFVENVVDYVNDMDICVLCNDVSGEGLSNSIMEYMGCAKPVIATDMGGNGELVVDEETGFLIPEKDEEALAKKIIYFVRNPEKGYEMGRNGQKRIYDLCGAQKIIQQFEEYYLNLMKN